MRLKALLAGAVLALGVAGAASAALPNYPTPGVENPALYTFTALANGDLTAYFALNGVTASYTEDLGLLVNGVDTGLHGLQNHPDPGAGASFDFGPVSAGDVLTFYIRVFNTGDTWFSNKALNSDGSQHIWATPYAGGDFGIPAGTYVAFEDLPACCTDFNYHDEAFVFTNTSSGAPEPLTWSLMITGFGAAGAMLRRARQLATA